MPSLLNHALRVLEAEAIPSHRTGLPRDESWPLAFDINGDLAVVSFAVADRKSSLERDAWSCHALIVRRGEQGWGLGSGDEQDSTWPAPPYARPARPTNSVLPWIDWPACGPVWGDETTDHWHCLWGVAPVATAALDLTSPEDPTRPLRISPETGAFVAVTRGSTSRLRGYDAEGRELGTMEC
jgi:hypothetical protein